MRVFANNPLYAGFLSLFLFSSGFLCEENRTRHSGSDGVDLTTVNLEAGRTRHSGSDGVDLTTVDKTTEAGPVVDLEYGIYRGHLDKKSHLNVYRGIRYAAPPIGKLRWQKPAPPAVNRAHVTPAVKFPPRCPQSPRGPLSKTYNFTKSGLGNEDCLFLNVLSPNNAKNLPVMVWIHGGGYGTGSAGDDFSELIATNSNGFIVVAIQYRLGAFGFLSNAEVKRSAVPNAGLYDMHFALEWVQKHIGKFGGDPSRVTIAGESAGGGAVMLQAMAYGGKEGTKYFHNAIAASPYLPTQCDYDDSGPGQSPGQSFALFAHAAGCAAWGANETDRTIFDCLKAKDSITLQKASAQAGSGLYGLYAFSPVTDGEFLQKRPTEQLLNGEVNGVRILTGNNADEGPIFVSQDIETNEDFDGYLQLYFQRMDNETRSQLASIYQIPATIPGPLFSTLGTGTPTALNQSEFAIGQQQRANNLYAETTIVCPSYWLATAYSSHKNSRAKGSWKYQYSVPPAQHGADQDAYEAVDRKALGFGTLSTGFRSTVQTIWGRFIIFDDPTLPDSATATLPNSKSTRAINGLTAAKKGVWPMWEGVGNNDNEGAGYKMLNINMTGGHETKIPWHSADGVKINLTQYAGPGLSAKLDVVDAWSWEGNRGARCAFWADKGKVVPE